MDVVRTIIEQAPAHLSEAGWLVIEIGHERAFFDAAFPELEPVWLDTTEASDQILLLSRGQLQS
jgi:ribosomal protein L3 glutamine methyltransferase